MKLTLAILACLAVAGINAASFHKTTTPFPVDKGFLEKQKFLFEILYRVEDPLQFEELIKFGGHLIVDHSKYEKYDEFMVKFYDSYKIGGLLPQGEFFSGIQKYHTLQSLGLFKFFYYAKDWETFVHNVVWARLNVNEGMFVNALTLAVIHRTDTTGLILPAIYEIFPQMFFNSKLVLHAEKFDFETFNKQIFLEKELHAIYHPDQYVDELYGKRFHSKDWKLWQWWKLMGIDEDWHFEEKTLFRDNIEYFKNDPKYKAVWTDIKAYWYPVDYSRDIDSFNTESKLSYFTEDLGWNAYWYYLNLDYAAFLNGKEFHLNKDRRGEFWIYNVQQLLARYYMERLSQGFGEIDEFSYYGIVKTGYNPQLIAYNGVGFSTRTNYWDVQSYQNFELFNRIVNAERRIYDIIDSGKYVTQDGVVVDFRKPEAIEYVGNLLQGNIDMFDRQFFEYWQAFSFVYLTGKTPDSFTVVPNVLHNYETILRDPISYQIYKKVLDVFFKFLNLFPAYTHEELLMPGVVINDVDVSKLKTFFDFVDTDVTNLMNDKMVFHDGKFVWDKTLLARQTRLNHKDFDYNIKVTADKPQKVVVRSFLAPSFNEYGQKIDLAKNREDFMEFDKFVFDLVSGVNEIKRNSKDFYYTVHDKTTYTEMYKYVMLAYEGKQEFPVEISEAHCGFPDRLILPHGWVKGYPVKMFFIISPYVPPHEENSTTFYKYTCGIGSGSRYIDDLPFGYPFDRKIEDFYSFFVPNMYYKDVKIYHADKFEKYYPNKYEHFGAFDYTY